MSCLCCSKKSETPIKSFIAKIKESRRRCMTSIVLFSGTCQVISFAEVQPEMNNTDSSHPGFRYCEPIRISTSIYLSYKYKQSVTMNTLNEMKRNMYMITMPSMNDEMSICFARYLQAHNLLNTIYMYAQLYNCSR